MSKTKLIAEIGCNHCGSIEKAIRLVEICDWAGVDAVKVQIRDVSKRSDWCRPYTGIHSYGSTYQEHREALELSFSEYAYIAAETSRRGMCPIASVWDVASVQTAIRSGFSTLKVPSALLTDDALLYNLRLSEYPVILSTGMSTVNEIKKARDILDNIESVLSCIGSYPTRNEDVNLSRMYTLQDLFPGRSIGVSGHWIGVQIDAAAVAMGAQVIERHITLDRNEKGTDHRASLEPDGIYRWVRDVRIIEDAIGSPFIYPLECEMVALKKLKG
jgi:N-acetylneuraminate synthase